MQNTGFDPTQRELCPDGACIGVIGPDGRCKECGALSPNGPPAEPEAPRDAPDDAAEASLERSAPEAAQEPALEDRQTEGDVFDPTKRELCPDGACIGVIGPDGRCRECGRPAE